MDYGKCKYALICKLINVRTDLPYMSKVLFEPAFADMAVTAGVLVQDKNGQEHFCPVNRQLAEKWGMSPEEILKEARKNMYRILTPKIYTMRELMLSERVGSVRHQVEKLMRERYQNTDATKTAEVSLHLAEKLCEQYEMYDKMQAMWVLSNQRWLFGASGLLYPRVLERFAFEHGEDFYILPSSLHEVILVPKSAAESEHRLFTMLNRANVTAIQMQRFLSDCVYLYRKDEGRIECLR